MKLILGFLCCVFAFNLNAQNIKEEADRLYVNGNYSKAIETYITLANLDAVYDDIAKAYMAIGNYGEAINNYEKAIQANADDLLIQYEYAKLLARTKQYKDANQLFLNLIASDSLNPNYYYELGVVLEKQKDTTALQQFQKTFELDETHQKAIFKISKHHLMKRNFVEAHGYIDRGLESYGNNVELISLKAQTYYHQEYYTHAVVWFNKLLDLGEKSEFIHEKLSLSYAQNSDYKDAIFHRKQALKYSPNDANAMFVIGAYYQSLSDFEMAEEYITKALLLKDVPLSDEYQRLGTIFNRQKKYDQAIKAFQKSLKEDPSNIMSEFYILRTKDEYYADTGSKIKMYEQFIEKNTKSPFLGYAEGRLKELKQEKFLEGE
ncbi:tetratricopeptide repeat protein [Winogradskyella thalassocola]|uniref:Tetratricopeptide repeat-containing protein n=1 Tax=Winogradskyella thalassocola TaxID=262004 RepID=A0A1G7Y240_9FLAO|nr:tetratricopeptide repeat protein [Winogradskyella thalassocola]SDG90518.1 Tetratricopeptide repeat-containing protein [Winogradskyella thalassocola]